VLTLEWAERDRERQCGNPRNCGLFGKASQKLTDYIIADFMSEVFGVQFEELKEELKFVKTLNFGLKEVTEKLNNFRTVNVQRKHVHPKSKRRMNCNNKSTDKENCQ
jgi:hypothetical protein